MSNLRGEMGHNIVLVIKIFICCLDFICWFLCKFFVVCYMLKILFLLMKLSNSKRKKFKLILDKQFINELIVMKNGV